MLEGRGLTPQRDQCSTVHIQLFPAALHLLKVALPTWVCGWVGLLGLALL